jgi:uncharacterized Tic20 family protein
MDSHQREARTWGMLCHLTALSLYVGIPFGNIIGPLVVWLIKKDEFPFVDEQGRASLNFQISILIYGAVAGVLAFVVIGIPLLIAIGVANLIFVILASVKANDGQSYQYPLSIKFL